MSEFVRHLAGRFEGLLQSCASCGEVLIDRRREEHVAGPPPGGWEAGAYVYRRARSCRVAPALPGLEDALGASAPEH